MKYVLFGAVLNVIYAAVLSFTARIFASCISSYICLADAQGNGKFNRRETCSIFKYLEKTK